MRPRLALVLPFVLVVFVFAGPAGARTRAPADSIGTPPGIDSVAQSRCAGMSVAPTILTVGQTLTGNAHGDPSQCKEQTWAWDLPPGFTPRGGGCHANASKCELLATAPSGTPGNRYMQECIHGTTTQGGWSSCGYYAVIPKCHGNPTLSIVRKRAGRFTLVAFQGSGWDTTDCGAVTLSAAGERGELPPFATYNTSSFKGVLKVNGRLCGLDLYARQAPNRERKASFKLGDRLNALIVFAHPATTSSGEQLFTGDYLCKGEVPADAVSRLNSGKGVTGADVQAIAAKLGVTLLEIGGPGWVRMADASGAVDVEGESIENAPGSDVRNYDPVLQGKAGIASFNSGTVQSPAPLMGYERAMGSVTVQGDLTCDGCVFFVEGDLTVSGSINGRGAIIATGNITAAGAKFHTDNVIALVAAGKITLP